MTEKTLLLRQRAADLLRTRWTKGKWVRITTTNGNYAWEPPSVVNMENLKSLREFLGDHGELNAKPDCEVCAEGAIYLACALDKTATGEDLGKLLKQMQTRSMDRLGCSIITFNDRHAIKAEDVLKKLFA